MSMHKALHPRDDDDSLYVSRKEGERVLASIEDSVDTSIQHEGEQTTAIRNDTDRTMDNRMTITCKQKWEEKQLNVRF